MYNSHFSFLIQIFNFSWNYNDLNHIVTCFLHTYHKYFSQENISNLSTCLFLKISFLEPSAPVSTDWFLDQLLSWNFLSPSSWDHFLPLSWVCIPCFLILVFEASWFLVLAPIFSPFKIYNFKNLMTSEYNMFSFILLDDQWALWIRKLLPFSLRKF